MVIRPIALDNSVARLIAALAPPQATASATGLWGSSAPMVAALAAQELDVAMLYVTAHTTQAEDAADDLEFFADRRAMLFPAWEGLRGKGAGSAEIAAERIRTCALLASYSTTYGTSKASSARIARGRRSVRTSLPHCRSRTGGHSPNRSATDTPLIVAPIQALLQPVPDADALQDHTLEISLYGGIAPDVPATPDALLEWAIDRGFERLALVESPGDVARRGDIVDIFAPGEQAPFRIEFFDDRIESIRRFDPGTQRSIESSKSVSIAAVPSTEWSDSPTSANLLSYLPETAVVVLDHPLEIDETGRTIAKHVQESEPLCTTEQIFAAAMHCRQLHVSRFAGAAADGEFFFDTRSVTRFEGNATDAVAELCRLSADRHIHVVCDNDGERQRLRELIVEADARAAKRVELYLGTIHRGFEWVPTRTIIVSHREIFHRQRPKRRLRRVATGRSLDSWTDLSSGDFVVHVLHGIAKYRGLTTMRKGASQREEDFLTLEFADRGVIHVPSSQIDLVQKYVGAGGRKPQLSKLGGKRWSVTKKKVAESIADLAEGLLRVQAIRAEATGTSYPADTHWQREFEAAFPYEETEDQLVVADEVKSDLTRRRPMDRLLCGDVGYGKTELAMRAAFKVVEYGRQVAVLVPTTILAEQHFETFRDRMAEYPFVLACLSRFRSGSEQRSILDRVRKGQVDIVIGTHRLLSKDVRFANLGLVVIDEEQRFGVEHKEHLKAMRETVDVLTMTATPIPRTLHMSMVGIRDISSLQTPPVDRRAISTQVCAFQEPLIRDAILRELNRDGQVYFIHNFVQSIAEMTLKLTSIVPEARFVYGHGQMHGDALAKVMHSFNRRDADVLVATTIIESGIDNPNVNTIFINRADRFGLADLHQLRGRVGRSDRHAYCYLLTPERRPLTPKSVKRLKTIEEFSELGAGFRIAMRDLEIRGAGNLLGSEQSGHIAAIGYELYCQLLDRTVRRLKNEPDVQLTPVHVDLGVTASIPHSYVSSERSRLEVYRRFASCRTIPELEQLEKDIADAFGRCPPTVKRLFELTELRIRARDFGIVSIHLDLPDVIFGVDQLRAAETLFAHAPGSVRTPDEKTVHVRLARSYQETSTLTAVLRQMFRKAAASVEAIS